MLARSREALEVEGEYTLRVPSPSLEPTDDQLSPAAELLAALVRHGVSRFCHTTTEPYRSGQKSATQAGRPFFFSLRNDLVRALDGTVLEQCVEQREVVVTANVVGVHRQWSWPCLGLCV